MKTGNGTNTTKVKETPFETADVSYTVGRIGTPMICKQAKETSFQQMQNAVPVKKVCLQAGTW